LETLEELACENKDIFIGAGGKKYHYTTAVNERDDHIDALVDIVKAHI